MEPSAIPAYQQPVSQLTEAELARLQAEILESFNVDQEPESALPWDQEASERYYALVRESDRREWESLTPAERQQRIEAQRRVTESVLRILSDNLSFAKTVNRDFDSAFMSSAGNPIQLRIPPRYA